MDRWVRDYNGTKIRVECEESELQDVLYQRFIVPFLPDLEYSWMCGTRAEDRAKGYIDYIASLMIRQPDKHNVIDPRKMRKIQSRELTGDGAADIAREMRPVKSKAKPKTRPETRTMRIDKIHKQYPGCKITICSVDTEGWFEFNGVALLLSPELDCYAPKPTKDDVVYDMDRVMVVEYKNGLHFYDQNAYEIESTYVLAPM